MTTSTLVGMFDDDAHARMAARDLRELGVDDSRITVTRNDYPDGYRSYEGVNDTIGRDHGRGIAAFFRRLFGTDVDEREQGLYSEAVRRGSTVVTVDVDEPLIDTAAEVLSRHGAVDIDRRAAQYRSAGFERFDESADLYSPDQARTEWETFATQRDVAIPVVEEELQVGKRTVNRGGVRIHTRVTERPVDEVVTLREEHVRVDRRAVDREATTADLDVMEERTMDITESAEEPVVAKRARVVEEVIVGKDVDEHEEHVQDTVRRKDVEVENVGTERRVARSDRDRT
jgi:uncharacterized protein (TIGR02271 family)